MLTAEQPRKSRKSNDELIDDLGSAASMKHERVLALRAYITWRDAMAGSHLIFMTGAWKVSGGRLGRDHTLEDVPNCYVRDLVMDYINTELPADTKQAAREAVFSDLTKAEIHSYSILIAERRAKLEAEDESPAPNPAPLTLAERESEYETIRRQYYHIVGKAGEMKHIARQQEALEAIDDAVDLTPRGNHVAFRNFDTQFRVSRSVVCPSSAPLPAEQEVEVEGGVTHDCDQVRAMIKRFVSEGEWTIDEFRLALGGVMRPQLNSFLEQMGPANGAKGRAFQLCWEFFYRREKLGLPLVGAGWRRDEDLLRKRGAKRRGVHGDGGSRGRKRPRLAAHGREEVILPGGNGLLVLEPDAVSRPLRRRR